MDVRSQIINYSLHEMKLKGFQGLRADKGIKELSISKGALYHHFPNKFILGYAVVEEVIAPSYISRWSALDSFSGNPIDFFIAAFETMQQQETEESIKLGCVLNNLFQEMSPLDEGFRIRLKAILEKMHQHMVKALQKGQQAGQVKKDIQAHEVAHFVQAGIEGAYAIAKVRQDLAVFKMCINKLIEFMKALKE